MDVPAVYVVLLLQVLLAGSCCQGHRDGVSSLRIVPSRLQLFEYSCVDLDCEGPGPSSQWTVMRRVQGVETFCRSDLESSVGRCEICPAFVFDSGEYWCRAKGGERSDSVNISVTGGHVILESPILPVTAGETVTLQCHTNTNASDLIVDFYRNGSLLQTDYKGTTMIFRVSVNDSGLYKCGVSGYGESAESWLTVRESSSQLEDQIPSEQRLSSGWVSVTVVAPLLLALGAVVYISSKRRWFRGQPTESATGSGFPDRNLPELPVYATVNLTTKKSRARPAAGAASSYDHQYEEAGDFACYSLAQVAEQL